MKKIDVKKINFGKLGGIVPAIVQDAGTNAVLMLAFMNRAALEKTLKTGKATFWSRTKKRLWRKGETSGNELDVLSVSADCDNDTLLVSARPRGPACHTGKYSCFGAAGQGRLEFLGELYRTIASRKKRAPEGSYTASLFREGTSKILAKVREESGEVLHAARRESKKRLVEETSDLLYHLFVLLVQKKITLDDITRELKRRSSGTRPGSRPGIRRNAGARGGKRSGRTRPADG